MAPQNGFEFPMPANARRPETATAMTHATSTAAQPPRTLANILAPVGQETFVLDPDLRLALEDMCSAALGRNWREGWSQWLGKLVSEALQSYLRG